MLGRYNHPDTDLNVILYKEIIDRYLNLGPKSACFHLPYKSYILANSYHCI